MKFTHIHIRKTAGITYRCLLRGGVPEVATGHITYKEAPKGEYVTVLREPKARLISLYKHLKRRPDIQGTPTIKELADLEYNKQITTFAPILEEAKRVLDTFGVVGVTERMVDTVLVTKLKYKLPLMFLTKNQNVATNNETITAEEMSYIKNTTKDEQKIYEYANQLLDAEIAKIPHYQILKKKYLAECYARKFKNKLLLK